MKGTRRCCRRCAQAGSQMRNSARPTPRPPRCPQRVCEEGLQQVAACRCRGLSRQLRACRLATVPWVSADPMEMRLDGEAAAAAAAAAGEPLPQVLRPAAATATATACDCTTWLESSRVQPTAVVQQFPAALRAAGVEECHNARLNVRGELTFKP